MSPTPPLRTRSKRRVCSSIDKSYTPLLRRDSNQRSKKVKKPITKDLPVLHDIRARVRPDAGVDVAGVEPVDGNILVLQRTSSGRFVSFHRLAKDSTLLKSAMLISHHSILEVCPAVFAISVALDRLG